MDIKSYLESKQIDFKTSGKNVTKGWVEINCVLPGCSDPSEHLGIDVKTSVYHCWLCDRKGPIINLIQIIENCSYSKAIKIAEQFKNDIEWEWEENESKKQIGPDFLPKEIEKTWPQIHLDYLRSRNFDMSIIQKFSLMPVYNIGKWRFRIIIPIIIDSKIVSFTGMDILRKDGRPPYLDCPVNECLMPVKHCLYNVDSVKDTVLIFEGVTGVWRFGNGSIATFTKNMTKEQINLLAKKKIKKAFILFDPDAEENGNKLAIQLSGIIPSVSQIIYEDGDPKDMNNEEIKKLKMEIGL